MRLNTNDEMKRDESFVIWFCLSLTFVMVLCGWFFKYANQTEDWQCVMEEERISRWYVTYCDCEKGELHIRLDADYWDNESRLVSQCRVCSERYGHKELTISYALQEADEWNSICLVEGRNCSMEPMASCIKERCDITKSGYCEGARECYELGYDKTSTLQCQSYRDAQTKESCEINTTGKYWMDIYNATKEEAESRAGGELILIKRSPEGLVASFWEFINETYEKKLVCGDKVYDMVDLK